MGFRLDDPEIAVTSLAAAVGQDKKRAASDVVIPFVTSPGKFVLEKVPLSRLRGELPGIRAEIRERVTHRDRGGEGDAELAARIGRGEGGAVVAELEARIAASPWDLPTLSLLAAAYRAEGNLPAALDTIKEVLARNPSDIHAQRQARDIEDAIGAASATEADSDPGASATERMLMLDEGAFELRPADAPEEKTPAPPAEAGPEAEAVIEVEAEAEAEAAPEAEAEAEAETEAEAEAEAEAVIEVEAEPEAEIEAEAEPEAEIEPEAEPDEAVPAGPAVRTVTMANLYWEQGDRETAIGIIEGILAEAPLDERALEWRASHAIAPPARDAQAEGALRTFLDRITKEYGHGISRDH
jgi:tetratricopeptide (TPR) repeat protein